MNEPRLDRGRGVAGRRPLRSPGRRGLAPGLLAAFVGAAALLASGPARAYRPFDGTDADVAELHVFELELGPAQYYVQGSQSMLLAPDLVLNLGIFDGTELVVDAQQDVTLGARPPGVPRLRLRGDDVLIKHIFREGTLQGKTGISLAAEGGALTPEINGQNAFGASVDVITSYRWPFATFHWNEWAELTRDQHFDLFSGLILEGPHEWTVRPVAEVFYDRDTASNEITSLLLGAIWELRESLALDVGLRGARVDDQYAGEARLGLTWALDLASGPHEEAPREGAQATRALLAPRGL